MLHCLIFSFNSKKFYEETKKVKILLLTEKIKSVYILFSTEFPRSSDVVDDCVAFCFIYSKHFFFLNCTLSMKTSIPQLLFFHNFSSRSY